MVVLEDGLLDRSSDGAKLDARQDLSGVGLWSVVEDSMHGDERNEMH